MKNLRDQSLIMWEGGGGGEGQKSWDGPGLFLEKRGGPKENCLRVGHVCCVKNHTNYNSCRRSK